MFQNVGFEFPWEIAKGRGYRIETQLTMAAKRACLHIFSGAAHQIQVFRFPIEVANALQDL